MISVTKNLRKLTRRAFKLFAPPIPLTIREWADRYRHLSKEVNPTGGRYDSATAPYQREPMEVLSRANVREIVLMWASQTGKTESMANIVGYYMDWRPSPMLVLQPTLPMAESFSKDRVAPMIRDTPRLRGKVKDSRTRDADNQILHKKFPGGHLTICGANSAASLAMRPIRVVICDEVDRYPLSAGAEGDPVRLASKRTDTFSDAKIILTSTPTVKDLSRVEKAFQESDQRYFHVPCPRCEKEQVLKWEQMKFDRTQPEAAVYICAHCQAELSDEDRVAMIRRGRWIATVPQNAVPGFHLSGLYCPFPPHQKFKNRLHQFVVEHLEALKLGATGERVWINTFKAETYDDSSERFVPEPFFARREKYGVADPFLLPEGVLVLVMGADVHPNRIEAEIVGYGEGEESWSIQFAVFDGSPATREPWLKLEEFYRQQLTHPIYGKMAAACGFIDQGHLTEEVYKFTKPRESMGLFACKGRGGPHIPPVSERPSRNNRLRCAVYFVGTDTVKDSIYSRLPLAEPGPRYMHFTEGRGYDFEWYEQLVSERRVKRIDQLGRIVSRYVKIRPGEGRNEALDIRVYGHAALLKLNPNWAALAKNLKARANPENEPTDADSSEQPRPSPTIGRLPRAHRPWVRNW